MKGIKRAFTLIELIVVITILAILGTIAFISMEGYSKQARDSKRISDVQNIKTTLELFIMDAGKYPMVDDGEQVSFSGELLRTQGFLGDTVTTNLSRNLQKKPTDPLSNAEYIYSVTNVRTEFEVMSVYEGDMIVRNNLIDNTHAISIFKPKVEGTYNQVFVKSANFIVPTPSIINSEVLPLDFKTNPEAIDSSVITGGDNFPEVSIPRTTVKTGALDINLSVYTGSIDSSSTDGEKIDAITAIQDAYSGTVLEDDVVYDALLSSSEPEDLIEIADYTILNTGTPPVVILSVPVNTAGGISFTDGDTNTSQISGNVTITAAGDEGDITDYVLYWGSDTTTKLGGAISTISVTGSDVTYIFLDNTAIPVGATNLLVFTKNTGGEMETGVNIAIGDNTSGGVAIPTTLAGGISFTDGDTNTNQVSGDVNITKASSEGNIDNYVLYWGSDASTKSGGAIATLPVTGSNVTHIFTENTLVPGGVTHLLVYTQNSGGEMSTGVSVVIGDDTSGGSVSIPALISGAIGNDGIKAVDTQGDYTYILGTTATDTTVFGVTVNTEPFFAKVKYDGTVSWVKPFSAISNFSGALPFNTSASQTSMVVDESGNIYMIGYKGSYFVASIDTNGIYRWMTLGDMISTLTTDGTYVYVAGNYTVTNAYGVANFWGSTRDVGNCSSSTSPFLVKFSASNGAKISVTDGRGCNQASVENIIYQGGNLYLFGLYNQISSNVVFGKTVYRDNSNQSTYIIKMNTSGVASWAWTLTGAPYFKMYNVDSNGNTYLSGYLRDRTIRSYSTAQVGNHVITPGVGNYVAAVYRVDTDGRVTTDGLSETQYYEYEYDSSNMYFIPGLTGLDSNGEIYVAGTYRGTDVNIFGTNQTSSDNGSTTDGFIVKIDSSMVSQSFVSHLTTGVYQYNLSLPTGGGVYSVGRVNGTNIDLFGEDVTTIDHDIYMKNVE